MSDQEIIAKVLVECVIKLDKFDKSSFEFVDLEQLLSVMDNAAFYMKAEIRGVDSLNGRWNILNDKQ